MTAHRPRKRFGQHFLHDRRIAQRIAAAFAPRPDDCVVEIGPGEGALTRELLNKTAALHLVELDRDLGARLQSELGDTPGVFVHAADALRFDYCALVPQGARLRLIGNLPYNISTELLFHLLDQTPCIQDMCFMLQREVVDRLKAPPGGKDYGRLSVMIQWRCRVEKLFDVAPGAFTPAPRVQSSVVRLRPYDTPPVTVTDPRAFAHIVRAAFAQRRKTLRNSLKPLLDESAIRAAGIDPGRRAETLSIEEFAALSNRAGQEKSV